MIPPGPHMLTYYSPGGFAAPIVRWMPLEGKQVVVMRWQAATEMLAEVVGEEEGQFAQGVRNFDFDSGLAPYNLAAYRVWSELAGAVTGSTLKRLLPVSSPRKALLRFAPSPLPLCLLPLHRTLSPATCPSCASLSMGDLLIPPIHLSS